MNAFLKYRRKPLDYNLIIKCNNISKKFINNTENMNIGYY